MKKPASLRSDLADRSQENSDRLQRRMSDRFRENPHLIRAFDMEALKKYVRVPHVTVSVVGYFLPIRLPRLA
jgi:hypothetical protein